LVALAVALVGCNYTPGSMPLGGNDDDGSDAASATDGGTDSMVDAPPPLPCGYMEQSDLVNDQSATAEVTSLTFSSPTVLCGQIDSGHLVNGDVDTDGYRVSVSTTTDVLVHVTAPGAENLSAVAVQVLSASGNELLAVGRFVGTHGTARINLPAATYIFAVTAKNTTAIASPLPYRIVIVADNPAARCTHGSAAATFDEAADGGNNLTNDMVLFDNGANNKFLTSTVTDKPEAVPGTFGTLQLSGSSAAVNVQSDSYFDRDTYEITTGPTTNQLSVRLNWGATTVDFDFLVLFQNRAVSFGSGLEGSFSEDEFDTMAVEPNTTYWVWVGADNTSSGLPAAYDVTVCGETFTPL
jgi:hypothetical protein